MDTVMDTVVVVAAHLVQNADQGKVTFNNVIPNNMYLNWVWIL